MEKEKQYIIHPSNSLNIKRLDQGGFCQWFCFKVIVSIFLFVFRDLGCTCKICFVIEQD